MIIQYFLQKKIFISDLTSTIIPDDKLHFYISKFLFSLDGGQYQGKFKFTEKLECGEPASDITLSIINFNLKFNKHSEIESMILSSNLTNSNDEKVIVWGQNLATWNMFEIVQNEVIRNVILALGCVMLCTIILILDWQMSFWIFVCVSLTTINIVGYVNFIGLKIDMISSFTIQVGVGLCIDYIVHIGHAFLATNDGNRNERAMTTVKSIGPAVFYGGSSTLLALSILIVSDSYIMQSFFKVTLHYINFIMDA